MSLVRRLRWPNRYWVDRDAFVDVLGQTGLRYHEGQRSLLVDSEVGVGSSIGVWASSIKWWERLDDREELTTDERAQVLSNIVQALKRGGYEVDVLP
jgi:hypothetical protein